jgi:hypothetical protein
LPAFLVEAVRQAGADVGEQFEVVDLGVVARPLEFDDFPVRESPPQALEGRRLGLLAADQEVVAAPGQVADGNLRLDV